MDRDSPEIEDTNAMNVDNEEKQSNNVGLSAEEDDEEYEIEEILDAKRGAFANGRMGYFVKWKGYDATENSWVDEQDIGGAKELVENYWKLNSKKGKRKSLEPKRARKSTAADQESDTSMAKKRGRKSTANADSDQDEDATKNKKVRKGATRGQVQIVRGIQDMAQYMDQENWEDLVDTVDTVERTSEGILFVYFTLKTGENVRERSEICRQRFPQQLLRFYESNLKWRIAEQSNDG